MKNLFLLFSVLSISNSLLAQHCEFDGTYVLLFDPSSLVVDYPDSSLTLTVVDSLGNGISARDWYHFDENWSDQKDSLTFISNKWNEQDYMYRRFDFAKGLYVLVVYSSSKNEMLRKGAKVRLQTGSNMYLFDISPNNFMHMCTSGRMRSDEAYRSGNTLRLSK